MNASSRDMKDKLVIDTSLVFNTDLFVNKEPSEEVSQNKIVTIYDTGGFDRQDGVQGDLDYTQPTIMARIRGDAGKYSEAYTLAETVSSALHNTANYEINNTRYIGIWRQGEVNFIEFDEKNRPIFTVNFRIHRTPV